MRKLKLAMVTMSMVCAMSFVGCGSSDKKETASPSPSASAAVETEQTTASVEPTVSDSTEEVKTDNAKKSETQTKTQTKAKTSQASTTIKKQTTKKSSTESSLPPVGTYARPFSEEIGGTKVTGNDYIIVRNNSTAYAIAQDCVKINLSKCKYDEKTKTITYEGTKYNFYSSGLPTSDERVKDDLKNIK